MVERFIVQHHGVQSIAVEEAADFAEERAAAHSGQIECALKRKRLYILIKQPPAQLGGLNGVHHRAEHALVAAAGHVGGQAHTQAVA